MADARDSRRSKDDLPFGQFATVGADAGVEAISTRSRLTAQDVATADVARAWLKAGRDIRAGIRIGYMSGSSGLLYGKVGYSSGRSEFVSTDTALPETNLEEGFKRDGVLMGGGVEIAMPGASMAKPNIPTSTTAVSNIATAARRRNWTPIDIRSSPAPDIAARGVISIFNKILVENR